ncbi:MAG: hypothetical protein M3Z75_00060 [Actinomycetota bacterium]|nr:hypothetical protein [Actinomycetota bacterium]
MKKAHKRLGLGVPLALVAASLLAIATTPQATAASVPNACGSQIQAQARAQGLSGVMQAIGKCPNKAAAAIRASDPANGTPPLLFHGGPVMDTPSTGPVVVTPIFWSPPGHAMSAYYKILLSVYLGDVALASGQNSNVFSVAKEYYGINGQIRYQMRLGFPILDSHPLPADGCQVASTDTSGIYADNSGYNACLDDAQIQAETDRVTAARSLPHNLSHIYVIYLPKHVESCFIAGSTTTKANACTINYQPSAAYCAYHSDATSNAIYANMPYPIYLSKTGFSCGTDINFPGVIESPNGNPDADTEISPTSHEISEAITDPDTVTGWYDSSGFENGDECAYIFGQTHGSAGHLYNQDINGLHFLTQEEFSNRDFALTGGGCVQSASAEAP